MILDSLWPQEAMRVINCQGCKYLGLAGSWGCCNYFLVTDNLRPNPFGVANCLVKKLENDPESVEKIVNKTLTDKKDCDKRAESRKPKWDTELGQKMFNEGKTFREIAEAVCRSEDCVYGYARRNGWYKDREVRMYAKRKGVD